MEFKNSRNEPARPVMGTIFLVLLKWYPLQDERAYSMYFWSFQKENREERGTEQLQQTYHFTQGYNILGRLQVHHLTITFIIHNKYNDMNTVL